MTPYFEQLPLWEHMNIGERMIVRQWAEWPTPRVMVKRIEGIVAVIGFIHDKPDEDCLIFDFVFAHPDHRRRGLGSAIVKHVCTWGRARVYAAPGGDGSEEFWSACGFAPVTGEAIPGCLPPALAHKVWVWSPNGH